MQKVNTQNVITKGIANINSGAIYVGSATQPATGASILNWVKNNANSNLSLVTVQLTPFGTSLNINYGTLQGHPTMFSNNCKQPSVRQKQICYYTCGVQRGSWGKTKSKKGSNLLWATMGGKGVSHNLGVIAQAVAATGGKVTTGTICGKSGGNTLAMLLTGTNSLTRPHAFMGKPIVQLVVKPNLK